MRTRSPFSPIRGRPRIVLVVLRWTEPDPDSGSSRWCLLATECHDAELDGHAEDVFAEPAFGDLAGLDDVAEVGERDELATVRSRPIAPTVTW